jgi:threonine dehydrogenase-like Zn-dependent dehydrogenase
MVKAVMESSEKRQVTKRIVVWGTGFVGTMVIAEIAKHP